MTPLPVTRSGPGARRRGGRAVTLTVCVLLAVVLVGCTSDRDTLGTNASQCFEALPVAHDAVHGRGTFAGVRLVSLSSFSADTRLRSYLSELTAAKVHDVCVISYRGTYTTKDVEKPLGLPPPGGVGHYAIVVVSKPQGRLVGTVVRLTQPLRFGHPV
jgi:hypothetical protein